MTKKAKRIIIAVIIAGVVAVVLGAVSSWYRNWNASTWFNYWGKGAPTAETEAPTQKAAAKAGLTHDSDYSESVTAEVKQYATPHVEIYDGFIEITTDGPHGGAVSIGFGPFMGGTVSAFTVGKIGGPSYGVLRVEFSTFVNVGTGAKNITFTNIGEGEYKNSVPYGTSLYVLPEDKLSSEMTMDRTSVKIPFPDYAVDNYELYYAVEIASADGKVKDTFKSNAAETDLFHVVTTDTERYIDVDLTALSFVNDLHPTCSVTAQLRCKFGPYDLRAVHACPTVYFGISKLAAPENVKYTDGILSWDAVDGAEGYAVFANNELYIKTNATSIKLTQGSLDIGSYTMRIRALGNVGSTLAANDIGRMTAFNAASVISQLVTITYDIDGDKVTKFVPYGSTVGDYLYSVEIPKKEFGGWYYDSGFSREVKSTDKLDKDTTIYARLTDTKTTAQKPSWWDLNKWYVIGASIGAVAIALIAGSVVIAKKRKD